jgi:hypothetical protein
LLTLATAITGCAAHGPAAAKLAAAKSATGARPPASVRVVQRFRRPVPPTPAQRRQIVAAVDSGYGVAGLLSEYEAFDHDIPVRLRRHIDYSRLRLDVTRIRVSLSKPVLASAAVKPLDRRGRQVLPTNIVVLSRDRHRDHRGAARWSWDLGPASSFPDSCWPTVGISLRELLCPSPWVVLGDRQPPGIPSGLGFTTPAGATSIRAVHWADIRVPGSPCGARQPIRLHNGMAYADLAVEPWWPAVMVYGGLEAHGQLGHRKVAVVSVECTTESGTADGQLAFGAVVCTLKAGLLSVIGVLSPQQPLRLLTPHVPLLGPVTIRNGEVIADEAWYRPNDGTAGASVRARTIWKLTHGVLRPFRTIVLPKRRH